MTKSNKQRIKQIRNLYKLNYFNNLNNTLKTYNKRVWSHQWLQNRNKEFAGVYNLLIEELAREQPSEFMNFVRMNEQQFNYLAKLIKPLIEKVDTNYRKCIPVKMRLAITLRFLATG